MEIKGFELRYTEDGLAKKIEDICNEVEKLYKNIIIAMKVLSAIVFVLAVVIMNTVKAGKEGSWIIMMYIVAILIFFIVAIANLIVESKCSERIVNLRQFQRTVKCPMLDAKVLCGILDGSIFESKVYGLNLLWYLSEVPVDCTVKILNNFTASVSYTNSFGKEVVREFNTDGNSFSVSEDSKLCVTMTSSFIV